MVDRVSDADRLKAIELVSNLDSKLLDYVIENKDKLYLNAELYKSLEATGLEPRNKHHWELVSESLEARLNANDSALSIDSALNREKLLDYDLDFKRLYLHKCEMVKAELIAIFKEYIQSEEEFILNPRNLKGENKFPYIIFKKRKLSIRMSNFCPSLVPGINLKKTILGRVELKAVKNYTKDGYEIFQDFHKYLSDVYEGDFNSRSPATVNLFYDLFSDFLELPKKIRLAKERWDSYTSEIGKKRAIEEKEAEIEAKQARIQIITRMIR